MTDALPFGLPGTSVILMNTARKAVRHAVRTGEPMAVNTAEFEPALTEQGACFVTLERKNKLRGCIGSLEARAPLIQDLVSNCHGAAQRDPRFPAITEDELKDLSVSISLLGPLIPFPFSDEADLLDQLQPGVDGLVLAGPGQRGTFLPQVWEDLPDPKAFLTALKSKSGLDPGHDLSGITAWRYRTHGLGPQPVQN